MYSWNNMITDDAFILQGQHLHTMHNNNLLQYSKSLSQATIRIYDDIIYQLIKIIRNHTVNHLSEIYSTRQECKISS